MDKQAQVRSREPELKKRSSNNLDLLQLALSAPLHARVAILPYQLIFLVSTEMTGSPVACCAALCSAMCRNCLYWSLCRDPSRVLRSAWESTLNKSDDWSTFVARSLERAASWRDYPIQRLGATALPRRRNVLAFADAFSVRPLPSEAASLLWLFRHDANLWPIVDFNRRHSSPGGFRTAAKLWKASVGIGSVGDSPSDVAGANNDLPPRDYVDEGSPSGGVSVLYVVTFGDGALEETQPMPSRPQEPQPPNPEWGAY